MTTIDIAHQQRLSLQIQRNLIPALRPGLHVGLCPFKGLRIDDLQFWNYFRFCLTVMDNTSIDGILQHPHDGAVGEVTPIRSGDVHLSKIVADPLSSETFLDVLVKDQANDMSRIFVNDQIMNILVSPVLAATFFHPVAIRNSAAGKIPAFG